MSVPHFTAFAAWTLDYIYNESLVFKYSCDPSPVFGTNGFDSGNRWFSPFLDQNPVAAASAAPAVDQAPVTESDGVENAKEPAPH
jgi:hypothetical protein